MAERSRVNSSTEAAMASGGSAGFSRSNAARSRDTNTTSPLATVAEHGIFAESLAQQTRSYGVRRKKRVGVMMVTGTSIRWPVPVTVVTPVVAPVMVWRPSIVYCTPAMESNPRIT